MPSCPMPSDPADCDLSYRVNYPDTDAAGVINHGRYIDMAERARHDLLQRTGLSYASLSAEHGTLLVVHRLRATYHASGVLEDTLRLRTRLTMCSPARSSWVTEIHRRDTLLATVQAELAALDPHTKRVRRHPDILLQCLAPYVRVQADRMHA
ncbi:4-hydroxybenzoyl-CoA thioesterase family active site [plant metagenome]|uniref:4-hydroxybenzoyl-CoA thioesterase family active site n=1 Tax=plant metagenome TaxID=1297885 RepID=A0A484QCK4_9ZZZZ